MAKDWRLEQQKAHPTCEFFFIAVYNSGCVLIHMAPSIVTVVSQEVKIQVLMILKFSYLTIHKCWIWYVAFHQIR